MVIQIVVNVFVQLLFYRNTARHGKKTIEAYAQQKSCISVNATVMILRPTTDGVISIY